VFRLRPIAVGLMVLPRFADVQVRRRVQVALIDLADEEGFAVAEVFEIDGRPVRDEASLSALEALAERVGARTVIASEPLDQEGLDRLTGPAKLSILTVPRSGSTAKI
jgi:hypothetical protein